MDVSSHEDSAGEFCCAGSIFFNEVVRIYEHGNKSPYKLSWSVSAGSIYFCTMSFRLNVAEVHSMLFENT